MFRYEVSTSWYETYNGWKPLPTIMTALLIDDSDPEEE